MRHESFEPTHEIDALDVAAVWPSTSAIAPAPVRQSRQPRVAMPEEAAPDMPVAAGVFLAAIYAILLATLAIATTGSGKSLFAIAIDIFFLFMFFTVPAALLALGNRGTRHPDLSRFMGDGMNTLTGHTTGGEVLVQMLVVPVCLTFGMMCIGIAIAIIF